MGTPTYLASDLPESWAGTPGKPLFSALYRSELHQKKSAHPTHNCARPVVGERQTLARLVLDQLGKYISGLPFTWLLPWSEESRFGESESSLLSWLWFNEVLGGSESACLVREDPLEESMATHSSILAWRIPWTEETGGLQSMGSQRVGHSWATHTSLLPQEGKGDLLFHHGIPSKSPPLKPPSPQVSAELGF